MVIEAAAEITLEVEAEVELIDGEFAGDPETLLVGGVHIPRESTFYKLVMDRCRADLEQNIADEQRNLEI
jgi:hypothetical protein